MEDMNKHASNLRTARPHLGLHPYILANTESCAVWSTLQESCQAKAILLRIQCGFICMFLLLMSCHSAFKMSWQLQNQCIQIGLFNNMIMMEVCRKIVVFKL
jgi:hypothetical protein